jgi:hypothetical protein
LTDCAKDRIDLDQSVLSFSMSQSSGSATTSSEASTMATTDAAPPVDLRNLVWVALGLAVLPVAITI